MNFSDADLIQIKKHGLTLEEVNQQLEYFIKGFPYVSLLKEATIGNGIRQYNEKQAENLIKLYKDSKDEYSITKFVPASGAATRMMKDFYSFLSEYIDEDSTPIINFSSVKHAIDNINNFAFYDLLVKCMTEQGYSLKDCLNRKDYKTIIEFILTEKGLNYGKYPKAWIVFHKSADDSRLLTAFEQHLQEAAQYSTSNGIANIHFTIAEEHLNGFENLKTKLLPIYEQRYKIKYNITFSFQQHSTDTIAVDEENQPIHNSNGELVFRPAGHGALINNLNKIDADIIFIKNIDNISSCHIKETIRNKELLAGVLIQTKQKINVLMTKLKQPKLTKQELVSIAHTINKYLNLPNIKDHTTFPTLTLFKHYLRELIDKPIRVCGMVRNTGEPGGGPFYVISNNETSLQIVETSQMCLTDEKTKIILNSSTHFNPVDLVISTKNWQNKSFNLDKFVDYQTGFITKKSFEGKTIKAMEKPGLWNGTMAKWITIFVEVPLFTFSPVKTLNDLLKKEHQ